MMTFISFNSFLASLQDEPITLQFGVMCNDYLWDVNTTRQLLAALDDGFELRPQLINSLPGWGMMSANGIGGSHFQRAGFEDDGKFTMTHFALKIAYWEHRTGEDQDDIKGAAAQLDRMFAAGRVSPSTEHLNGYERLLRDKPRLSLIAPLAAHIDTIYKRQETRLRNLISLTPVDAGTDHYIPLEVEGQILRDANQLREQLFLERWLPSAISGEELLAVQNLAPELLHDLYPDVWAEGYAGYYDRVQGQTS